MQHINSYRTDKKILDRKALYILLLILAVSLLLRIWGIWFGLPHVYHPDEGKEVIRALALGAGSFDFNRIAKAGYFYLLFLEYGIYFVILKLIGVVQSRIDFAYLSIRDPSAFYLIGRITTALIGTLNVFVIYVLGKKVYSSTIGILAALFLAFNFLHAQNSHYITLDVPMTCLSTLSIWYIVRVCQTGRLKYYILAGLFSGLAIQTKAPAIVLVVPYMIAHFFVMTKEENRLWQFFFKKEILLGFSTLLLVFIAGNPGFILHFQDLLKSLAHVFLGAQPSSIPEMVVRPRTPVNLWTYYFHALERSMGVPLLIISILALGHGLYKRKKEDVLLIGFFLSYYSMMSLSKHPFLFYYRYMMPVLPILALLSARLIGEIGTKMFPNKLKFLVTCLACILIIEPGYRIVRNDYLISHKDTRTFAKEWIENNIAPGSKILIEGSRTMPGTVPLQNSSENIMRSIKMYREKEPAKAKYLDFMLKVLSGKTYDLVLFGEYNQLRDLSYYERMGVEYIIVRPDFSKRKHPKFPTFYKALKSDPQVTFLQRFEPNSINRPGLTIEIYSLTYPQT